MNKKVLSSFQSRGGLNNPTLRQLCLFEYLHGEEGKRPKLALNIGIEYVKGGWRESPSSLRVDTFEEGERFLGQLIVALAYFGVYSGKITQTNYSYHLANIQKIVSEKFIHTMRCV